MKVTILGSADAFNSAARCHSCYLIESEGAGPVMVDIGGSGLVALRRAGRDPAELKGLAITHLHGDHLAGLPFLLLDSAYNIPRAEPLPMVGPIGLSERMGTLFRATYRELTEMRVGFEYPRTEIRPRESAPLAGFTIEAFAADHMDPPDIPLSLRFTDPAGRVAAFSGDTAMNPDLLACGTNADIFVAECSAVVPPIGRHCTWEDWKAVFPQLTAQRLVLSHLNHRVRNAIPQLMPEAPEHLELTFADDGMVFEV